MIDISLEALVDFWRGVGEAHGWPVAADADLAARVATTVPVRLVAELFPFLSAEEQNEVLWALSQI